MTKKNALGKGLGAIFTDLVETTRENNAYRMCGVEELSPNRFQPRKVFDKEDLESLVASIREKGIIQPIVVRPLESGYEIIAGERRWRAAQVAGLKEVPIVIRDAEDIDTAELSLIENIQREELNPIEEANAYQTLINTFRLSQDEISTRVGKDRSTIANSLRLLRLPSEIHELLSSKKLSAGHARALLSLEDKALQLKTALEIVKRQMSVRETERIVKKTLSGPSTRSKEKIKDTVITDLEGVLSNKFMAKTTIKGNRKSGSIEIRYTSDDELKRITDILICNTIP